MTLCPGCFDRLSAEGSLPSTRKRFRDYGRLARAAVLLGILFFFVAPVSGLVAVLYAARALKQKKEMGTTEGRNGAYVIMGLGVLEAVGGAVLLIKMFS